MDHTSPGGKWLDLESGAIGMESPDELEILLQHVEVARRSEELGACLRVVPHTKQMKVGRVGCDKMELG